MEELVLAIEYLHDQYYYSKIFFEMVPENEAQFDEPAYY